MWATGIIMIQTTGRFLNRNAKPDQTNPYVPWGGNPTGAFFAPLALLSLLYSRRKKRGTLDIFIVVVLIGVSLSMSLTACTPTATVTMTTNPPATPTARPTMSVAVNGETVATSIPESTSTPVYSSSTCTLTLTTFDYTNDQWNGIVNVIYYETASSFKDPVQMQDAFEKGLWALRSEQKYDTSYQGLPYYQMVLDKRFTASGHYGDLPAWPPNFLTIAQQILGEQRCPPPQFANEAIYWISATHFLRRAPYALNQGTPNEWIKSELIPGSENCPDKGCAFPDIRWRNELYSKSVDREERFIRLPEGTYRLYYVEYNQNQYEECYWIGVYFSDLATHNDVYNRGNTLSYPAPNYPVNDPQANGLKCPL